MHAPVSLKDIAGNGPDSALPNTSITSILVQLPTEAGIGPDNESLVPKLFMSTNAPTRMNERRDGARQVTVLV